MEADGRGRTYENYRHLVTAVVAQTLLDIGAGHQAKRFDMPMLGNRLLSLAAYNAYLSQSRASVPESYSCWYRTRRDRAQIKMEYAEDAEESLATPELRELCFLADVYLPPEPSGAIALIQQRVESGQNLIQ